MKRRILGLFTAFTILASLFTVVPASAETATYKSLDLSLTQTSFEALNASGQIKAYLIAEETVTMPVLSINSSSAVELNDDGSYRTTEGTPSAQPQRKAIENGTLTYSTPDSSVINLANDGSFTTVGYGVANVKVTYDNNTPTDTADDVSSNVMITVSDESKLELYGGTYTGGNGYTILKKVNGITASGVSGRSAIYARYNPDWDPMGTTTDPLVFKSSNNSGEGEATAAIGAGDAAVFSGWFYDNMLSTSQKFLSFGYAGTTDAANVTQDGNSSMMIMAQDASEYKLLGGVYTGASEHLNYDYGKMNASTSNADGTIAGVSNVAKRSVGWHQFVVTAESSIVNPGNDYMLIKAYLDGELITSQDIYVGNVEIGKRRFNIYAGPRTSANQTVWYKDLSIRGYKRSGVIAESIPSDGAENVPLRQLVKVKLTSAATTLPTVSVTSNGSAVASSASLDSTGTILTVNLGNLTAGASYTVTVDGESFSFTAGSDSEMAAMLDSMTDYKIKDTRYVDFADSTKSAEEYGVGFVHNNLGTDGSISTVSEVKQNYLTMTENARDAMSTGVKNNPKNGIVIRNVSPRNGDADRVVISYKFNPKSITTDTDTLATSAGIGRPFMAKDNSNDAYNNLETAMISGGQSNTTNNLPVLVADNNAETAGYKKVRNYMLMGNATNTGKGVTESNKDVSNGDLYFSVSSSPDETKNYYTLTKDSDGYYRLTYVIDVDKSGVNAPAWTTIFGDDLDNNDYIFKLKQTPTDATAYTSVDSIFIPMSKGAAAITTPIELDIKDIEIYHLTKTIQAQIDDQPTVKETETDTEILAGNLAGKTVDVSINAQGDGDDYTIIVAAMAGDNKLLSAKTAKGTLGASKNIGVTNFAIPASEENVKLYVFVWNSFENAVPLFTKIEYTKAE